MKQTNVPTLIQLDYKELICIRERVKANEPSLMPAYSALLNEADSYLQKAPDSVVNKGHLPPSGDMHDFFAIGKYAWRNPDTPDGIPFIRRDGYTNPAAASDEYDLGPYFNMRVRVNTLALAYLYSDSEAYAAKAAELLRVWFLNPETRMNPNFKYAASLPGVNDGMAIGIIEGVQLIGLLDSVNLLTQSISWTQADNEALQQWFAAYCDWLLESPAGKEEYRATDNHGSWYAAQLAAFSIYIGNLETARQMMERAKWQIDVQFTPDGGLHRELKRNRALFYSLYGLSAFVSLARCGDVLGVDLWRYRTEDGRGIELGFQFLAPYLAEELPWAWQNIDNEINGLAVQLTRRAEKVYSSPRLIAVSRHLTALRPPKDWSFWLMTIPS
ncbi:alginate lyase family protein [Paenibacillus sp. RC67]|uniref:alginate lyase family protein n=1 Tax=Paenibacillus sp. RC67 TaxID=3039392 RepID=UPI0024AD220F|nr:alginate lyase family protein [Paenibacillus sp. RC67]